jgi:L-arabinose isomerase
VFTAAVGLEAIADLAQIAGIELIAIDESSELRGLLNELRWNQAYYDKGCG